MKKSWYIAIAVVAVVAIGVATIMVTRRQPREVRLTDGTALRLEKVSFGKREPFRVGSWWQRTKERVAPHLPKKWADKLAVPATTNKTTWGRDFFQGHTNDPALHVWLTRINTATGKYENVDVRSAELVDADGCVMGCTLGGGEDRGLLAPAPVAPVTPVGGGGFGSSGFGGGGPAFRPRSSVTWFSFEVFPRREKEFKLRLYDAQRKLLAEFTVSNPAPRLPATRPAPPLPVAVTNGAVVFRLKGASLQTNVPSVTRAGSEAPIPRPRSVTFEFESLENDKPNGNWDIVALELKDSSGNTAPKGVNYPAFSYPYALCTSDPEWRLEVKFVGREDSSDRTWVVRGVAVPGTDSSVNGPTNTVVDGLAIKMIGVGGPGRFNYSNTVPNAGSSSSTSSSGKFSISISRMGGSSVYKLDSDIPHLAVLLGDIGVDQWLTVRAIDEQGRRYDPQFAGVTSSVMPMNVIGIGRGIPSRGIRYLARAEPRGRGPFVPPSGEITFMFFEFAADVKTIDVEFRVQRARTVEFAFKPPGREKPPNK